MSVSTAMAVKGALFERLPLRAGLSGVQIAWDRPVERVEGEVIHLGDIESTEEWAEIGAQAKWETYLINVMVIVEAAFEDDPRANAERASALWEEIAALVREDPTFGCLPGLVVAAVAGWKSTSPSSAKEAWRQAVIEGRLRVKARI